MTNLVRAQLVIVMHGVILGRGGENLAQLVRKYQ